MTLSLPSLDRLESVADPKSLLFDRLYKASGLRPGRLHRFVPALRLHRLAEIIEDFSPLRCLPAFQALEDEMQAILAEHGWL